MLVVDSLHRLGFHDFFVVAVLPEFASVSGPIVHRMYEIEVVVLFVCEGVGKLFGQSRSSIQYKSQRTKKRIHIHSTVQSNVDYNFPTMS